MSESETRISTQRRKERLLNTAISFGNVKEVKMLLQDQTMELSKGLETGKLVGKNGGSVQEKNEIVRLIKEERRRRENIKKLALLLPIVPDNRTKWEMGARVF